MKRHCAVDAHTIPEVLFARSSHKFVLDAVRYAGVIVVAPVIAVREWSVIAANTWMSQRSEEIDAYSKRQLTIPSEIDGHSGDSQN